VVGRPIIGLHRDSLTGHGFAIGGYCYTQLTDVEQEQNGVYNYDRTTKFDMKKIASSFGRDPKWWKTRR
jgi:hypothetical protein